MRLQTQISRKVGDTEYTQSWIVIAPKVLKELGWKSGQELKAEVKGNKLIVEKD